MHNIRRVNPNNITPPIESLAYYFRAGGATIIQAAFSHSFFVDPNAVRKKTPMYSDRARYSRTHYPVSVKGNPQHGRAMDVQSFSTTTNTLKMLGNATQDARSSVVPGIVCGTYGDNLGILTRSPRVGISATCRSGPAC